ncbi:MAG: glycosyltransferase family 4 protein [Acidimicrobiia bacterium]
MPSLLVTNDFPPKFGGIQSYLYELWRRLPDTTVLTTPYDGAAAFDAAQTFRVDRVRESVLLPRPGLAARIDALAREVGAATLFVDPMLPLGIVGCSLRAAPHLVIAHGAEITLPGRLPGPNLAARSVLRAADGVIAAGEYPAREVVHAAGRLVRGVVVPPGVDVERFRPLDIEARAAARRRFGLDPNRPLVLGASRLVPRKGFDVVIDAVAGLDPLVQLAIGGAGRDRHRLEARVARRGLGGRVRFLGRVPDADLPALYASADVFAMACRDRWLGLEAEGFGIVFLEAAATGVPAVAGRSGGSHEAVVHGETGYVVDPRSVAEVRRALMRLLDDESARHRFGSAARARAVSDFSYDTLAARLVPIAAGVVDALPFLSP